MTQSKTTDSRLLIIPIISILTVIYVWLIPCNPVAIQKYLRFTQVLILGEPRDSIALTVIILVTIQSPLKASHQTKWVAKRVIAAELLDWLGKSGSARWVIEWSLWIVDEVIWSWLTRWDTECHTSRYDTNWVVVSLTGWSTGLSG